MADLRFDREDAMLLSLLGASLGTVQGRFQARIFADACDADWERCYRLASTQGVRALAWDGILMLPEKLQPSRAVKLMWGADVAACEERYSRHCRAVRDLMDFLNGHGIASVQLKGVGLSSYYPVPSHREGGDIDIFTWSADPSKISDAQANSLTDLLMEERGIKVDRKHSVKHSIFYWQGIPVENHRTFLNVTMYRTAEILDRELRSMLDVRPVTLDGDFRVSIPSPEFNTVFVAFHAVQHYLSGLSLHHICDWACLIRHCGLHVPSCITDVKFLKAISAFTSIARDYLGIETDIPADPSGLDKRMLDEILHPTYSMHLPQTGKAGILLFKTRRLLHRLHCCREVVDESALKRIMHSALLHIQNPGTIFG